MYSGRDTRALPRVGFPIRKSRDQRLVSTSPALIAAAHVLLRLLAPRHPPCALHLLIVKNTVVICRYGVFKVRMRPPRSAVAALLGNRDQHGLSKLSSVRTADVEVDVSSRRAPSPDGKRTSIYGRNAYRGNCLDIPRKEVIQPQLPLRLPCYDFTPVTNPTFGGCLPCGLAHRLRVLPASVV